MFHCGMRQVEERHVANKVDRMVWSDRLDLLALSNYKGDVQVHRLQWQKVWSLPPLNEGELVTAMAWRPDGKALAIAYSSGWVLIIDIEDKEVLDKFHMEHKVDFNRSSNTVTCMRWPMKADLEESTKEEDIENVYDDASIFLPKPSSLNDKPEGGTVEENTKNIKEIKEQMQLNILLIGYGFGNVHMRVFGKFPLGSFFVGSLVKDEMGEFRILDINMSDDFSSMQIIYRDRLSEFVIATVVDTFMLCACADDILSVANKHSQIAQLMSYMDQTMASINEAWETILLEMDKKMAEYAASVPEGGVSADFLELLMLGAPSDALEVFLLQELTAKGLKKFGSSVEMSYSAIQKLVLKQLNIVGQSLMYYLCELRGVTRVPERYQIMGLEESVVSDSIKAGFAFLNKCLELQQVIDSSMRNYKTFFRWLFVVIVRLLDEQTPSEIVKITQQDQMHIAEFLYNFDNAITHGENGESEKPVKFNLERLGQYLQNQELKILPDDEDNPWHKFLEDNRCYQNNNETIFHPTKFRKYSLIQQQNHLKKAIDKVFDITSKDFGSNFSVLNNFRCISESNENNNNLKVSQIYDPVEKRFLFAIVSISNVKDGLFFMCVNNKTNDNKVKAIRYYFSDKILPMDLSDDLNREPIPIIDVQFYSHEYLSVLINHPQVSDSSIFVQVPVKIAIDNANELILNSLRLVNPYVFIEVPSRDISPLLDQGLYKVLDKMDGLKIAVSGGRTVAVVLSKSHRKVRVFLMEADIDDENEEDVTPQSLRSDASPNKSALNITAGSEDMVGE